MNVLTGQIASIQAEGHLSLVRVHVGEISVTAIVVDTPGEASFLEAGAQVRVIFKETEVIIGKGPDHQVSLRNQFPGRIGAIEQGQLLSRITVESAAGPVVSVITTNAVRQLGLRVGSEVTAMVKTNEMMLSA